MEDDIITVTELGKVFESKQRKSLLKSEKRRVDALKSVSFSVKKGEIFGLLGPNGAGKTTLIKCLTTLLIPSSGTATINGYDLVKDEKSVRGSLGCMLMGERGLYWKLTGRENLDFFGALYHVPKEKRRAKAEELVKLLEMQEYADRTVETYSSGQKMTMAFAKSLINDAPIIVLDEPTVTMDVHTARKIREIVKKLNADGHTILYTTHLMAEADELCDRVAIIDKGEIKAMGTPAELKSSIPHKGVIELEGVITQDALDRVSRIPGVTSATVRSQSEGRMKAAVAAENPRQQLPHVINALFAAGATIEYVKPGDVTLEDVFIHLTGRTLAQDTRVFVKEAKTEGGGGG